MTAHNDPMLEHLSVSAEELWVLIDSVAGGSRVLSGLCGHEQVWWATGGRIREPVSLAETLLVRDLLDALWLDHGPERDYDYQGVALPARLVLLTSRARRWAANRNPHWWVNHRPVKDDQDDPGREDRS